jgi:hypothetical protein
MPSLLSQLTKSEQARLLEELNYMNLEEIRGFCSKRGIPYRIVAESTDGTVKATKDADRKPIVLARVRRYLATGQVGQPTRIPEQIVREESPPARPDLAIASTIGGMRRSSRVSCGCFVI